MIQQYTEYLRASYEHNANIAGFVCGISIIFLVFCIIIFRTSESGEDSWFLSGVGICVLSLIVAVTGSSLLNSEFQLKQLDKNSQGVIIQELLNE